MNKQEGYPNQSQETSDEKSELFADVENQEEHEATLRNQSEKEEELPNKHDAEQEALQEATELAKEADKKNKEDDTETTEHLHRGAPSKKQLRESFNAQMRNVQEEFSYPKKLFSKFLHAKPVESTSDFIGSTIARPNALLSGSIAAFLSVTATYFIAKHFGFQLSGFETIGAFFVGWVLGLLYDYFSGLVQKRRK